MFDRVLLEEIRDFRKGIDNIYVLKYKHNEINKIIENRTKDKIWFIQNMGAKVIADSHQYKNFMQMIKSDYIRSKLYINGLVSIKEIE